MIRVAGFSRCDGTRLVAPQIVSLDRREQEPKGKKEDRDNLALLQLSQCMTAYAVYYYFIEFLCFVITRVRPPQQAPRFCSNLNMWVQFTIFLDAPNVNGKTKCSPAMSLDIYSET